MEEEEGKREKKKEYAIKSSSTTTTMANSVAFSDEIPSTNNNNNNNNTSFGGYSFSPSLSTSIFDMMMMPLPPFDFYQKQPSTTTNNNNNNNGFMDLLALHDYTPSLFDWLPSTTTAAAATEIGQQTMPSPASSNVPDCSEVLNTPASPNSSSISSSSNEGGAAAAAANKVVRGSEHEHEAEDEDGDGGGKGGEEDQDQDKTKKQLKVKKKNQKKQREPRFAFMTKSEVDHLDDGYRWRKYGQKAVKNSPYPRSYYRCTTSGCGVKKRVERSSEDPSIVVTTYEGQHTHPCPATSRASLGFMHHDAAGFGPLIGSPHFVIPHQQHTQFQQQQQQQQNFPQQAAALLYNSSSCSNSGNVNATTSFGNFVHHEDQMRWEDNGLLEDIVPTQMITRKEEDEIKDDHNRLH